MKPCPARFGACTSNEEITTPKAKTVFRHQRLPGLQLEIKCIHADFIPPSFSKGNDYIQSIHVSKISIHVLYFAALQNAIRSLRSSYSFFEPLLQKSYIQQQEKLPLRTWLRMVLIWFLEKAKLFVIVDWEMPIVITVLLLIKFCYCLKLPRVA